MRRMGIVETKHLRYHTAIDMQVQSVTTWGEVVYAEYVRGGNCLFHGMYLGFG
jgi:hypothetical protein